jgi:hypothetical protein
VVAVDEKPHIQALERAHGRSQDVPVQSARTHAEQAIPQRAVKPQEPHSGQTNRVFTRPLSQDVEGEPSH